MVFYPPTALTISQRFPSWPSQDGSVGSSMDQYSKGLGFKSCRQKNWIFLIGQLEFTTSALIDTFFNQNHSKSLSVQKSSSLQKWTTKKQVNNLTQGTQRVATMKYEWSNFEVIPNGFVFYILPNQNLCLTFTAQLILKVH